MSKRNYGCKDADMLVASNVVMQNFDLHKDQLVSKRKNWADPFGPNLHEGINSALDILGIDTKINQTAATRQLMSLQTKALADLATFKIQLEVDFEDKPEKLQEILKNLGFTRHYNSATDEQQEAVVQLLSAFKKNMSPELRQEIEAAGIDGVIIDDLIAMRDPLNALNVQQEALKNSTPKDTAVNVEELNAIYKKVIGICKIAPRILENVPSAGDDFSFKKILSRLH